MQASACCGTIDLFECATHVSGSRLPNRGDLSVRCATGRVVSAAEDEQRRGDGLETAIGLKAYENGSVRLKAMFGSERKISNLLYEDLPGFLGGSVEAPVVITTPRRSEPSLRAHSRH